MRTNCYKPMLLALTALCLVAGLRTGKAANSVQLITSDHKWRFSHQNLDFGTAWRAPGYVDTVAGWEGPSNILFGFESTEPEYSSPPPPIPPQSFNTRFPNPVNEVPYVTNYYFRTHFTAPAMPGPTLLPYAQLVSTNYIDDGCIYYLNGVEILRYNMPTGAVTATTYASGTLTEGYSPTANESIFIRTNGLTNINWGADNVMAIEVHNATNTSSDEVFGMVLALVIPDPLVITRQPVGTTNYLGEVSSNVISVAVSGSNPSYQWYSNNVKIASATSASYSTPVSQVGSADYYAIITNVLGSATSAVARVTIVPDTFPIQLLSAFSGPPAPPGTALSNQVLLTFNKRVQGGFSNLVNGMPFVYNSPATNLNSYSVRVFGSSTTIPVTAAALSLNLVRLTTTSNLIPGSNYDVCVSGVAGTNLVPIVPNPTCLGVSMTHSNTPPPLTNLVAAGATWDFNQNNGTDVSGNPLGTAWIATNYVEDFSWGSGSAIFYYDNLGAKSGCNAGASTGISQGQTTTYYRTTFLAPSGLPSSGNLVLMYFVDDGAVYYLNGTEIYRNGMPAGVPTFTTAANTTVGNPPPCVTATVSITNLLYKTNVMAVEVHQGGGAGDPHAYFGLQVDYQQAYPLLITNTAPVPPKMTTTIDNNKCINLSWTPTVGGLTWGLDSTTDLKNNGVGTVWTQVQNTSPFQDCSHTGPRKFYILHKR